MSRKGRGQRTFASPALALGEVMGYWAVLEESESLRT